MRYKRAAFAAALATAVLPAAAAQASTAGLEGTALNVVAGTGERNSVSIGEASGATLLVRDPAGLRARTGCEQITATEARCGGLRVNVSLGDQSDSLVASTDTPVAVDAGAGAGDDSYVQNALGGTTRVDFSGGAGQDAASYANADRGVIVTKDGVANDGRIASGITSLDRDSIRADVERLTGSRFSDSLNGTDATFDRFDGNLGDDVLSGHGLHDVFVMGSVDDGSDRILGGAGTDIVDYCRVRPAVLRRRGRRGRRPLRRRHRQRDPRPERHAAHRVRARGADRRPLAHAARGAGEGRKGDRGPVELEAPEGVAQAAHADAAPRAT
jgi:hypothetical protein